MYKIYINKSYCYSLVSYQQYGIIKITVYLFSLIQFQFKSVYPYILLNISWLHRHRYISFSRKRKRLLLLFSVDA